MSKTIDDLNVVNDLDNSYILVSTDDGLRKLKIGAGGQSSNIQTVEVRINDADNNIQVLAYPDFNSGSYVVTSDVPETINCPILLFDDEMYHEYGYVVIFTVLHTGDNITLEDSNGYSGDVNLFGGAIFSGGSQIPFPDYVELTVYGGSVS